MTPQRSSGFVSGKIRPNTTGLKRLTDGFRKAPSVMKTVHTRNTRRFISRVLAQLKVTPPPIRGKVPWASLKQQRAFFASNGFGGGIPHRRTGAMIKGWKGLFNANDQEATIEFLNNQPGAIFVFGIYQQRMHKRRFANAPAIFKKAQKEYQTLVEEDWRTASDPRAGVR
jgi:hypothetical protein